MTTYGHHSVQEARERAGFLGEGGEGALRALARAIGVVHELGPKMWAVTLLDRLVRLTFGPVEVFVIYEDGAWFPVAAGRTRLPRGVEREGTSHHWFAGAERLIGSHTAISTAFDSHTSEFADVVRQVRGRFKVDHYLNGAAKKAHARGLLAYLEERLGLELPHPIWDEGADSGVDEPLHDEAVFTAVSRERLATGKVVFEGARWSRARRSFEAAEASGARMPILFGDAANSVQTLVAWAVVRDIRLSEATTVTFEELRGLVGHTATELTKLSNGEPIDEGYQRAYVPCRMPEFLLEEVGGPEDIELQGTEGTEGRRRLVTHLGLERRRSVVEAAKRAWAARDRLLRCEVCGFSAQETYGQSYCEAHHRVPLASVEGQRNTTVEDLACVCANCHQALHGEGGLTVEDLRGRIARKQGR